MFIAGGGTLDVDTNVRDALSLLYEKSNSKEIINTITNMEDNEEIFFKEEAIYLCKQLTNQITILKAATYVLPDPEEDAYSSVGYGQGQGYVVLSSSVAAVVPAINNDVLDNGLVEFSVSSTDEVDGAGEDDVMDYHDEDDVTDYDDEDDEGYGTGYYDDDNHDYDYDNDNQIADPNYQPDSHDYNEDSRDDDDDQDRFSSASSSTIVLGESSEGSSQSSSSSSSVYFIPGVLRYHRSNSSRSGSVLSQPSTFNSTLSSTSDVSILPSVSDDTSDSQSSSEFDE
ncbi:unnamed protein product [Rotaria sordida]|uniref:Uncharacterized protein n=1 Tax=Rotaria sordida TaxID=392033 RepID=A0A814S908_9BILA|nr:unnamed protein product [Rotaria sordida]CAF1375617.1 unnamed protein product [Rotaria sordida]